MRSKTPILTITSSFRVHGVSSFTVVFVVAMVTVV